MTDARQWPDRATWANNRQTLYLDETDGIVVSADASRYGTPEELATAIRELEVAIRHARRLLTQTRRAAGALWRQPGETATAYVTRWLAMTEAEQARTAEPIDRGQRRDLREALAALQRGELPSEWSTGLPRLHGLNLPTLARLLAKREAARDAAIEAVRRQRAATPVDDAAWAEELARRADYEAERAAAERRGWIVIA